MGERWVVLASTAQDMQYKHLLSISVLKSGACPGFLKGGSPISLGSLKKGHQILKGSNGLMGGGQVH